MRNPLCPLEDAKVLYKELKNRVSGPDPALGGFCKCSHIIEYAALSKTPPGLTA
jgi:hypothetical protein